MPRPGGTVEIRFGETLSRRRELARAALTCGPAVGWVSIFLLVPLAAIVAISFLTRGAAGGFGLPLTGEHFLRLLGFGALGFEPLYPLIIARSLLLAAGTTAVCVAVAFPLAFFIAALDAKRRAIALTLVVIPFWTNLLIRTYAWQILLAPASPLTRLAAAAGLAGPGEALYPGTFAVYIGMLCAYLPFLVLPLYTAVEKLDWSLVEAARDLGADGPRVFRHAVLPQVVPGLVAGVVLVFVPATGQFVIPDLLGGAKTVLLGSAIQQQFGASQDWPFGSAIALVGMGIVMTGLWLYARTAGKRGSEDLP